MSDADFRVTAKFKGLIRVTMGHAVPEPLFDLNTLLRPQGYKVRVYVLRAMQLAAMDMDLFGRPGKSDPYLKVSHLFVHATYVIRLLSDTTPS